MQPADFSYLSELLKRCSGLALTDDKEYLINSRLLPIARQIGLEDISQLCQHMQEHADDKLLAEVVEAMTTNESSFFRDIKPFEQLRTMLLPELMAQQNRPRKLRIWSAACSSGQEPYSIAMCLEEEMENIRGYHIEIIASDLAGKVVDKARQGIYSQFEVQRGLPIQLLVKYFTQQEETLWKVKDNIRDRVQFYTLNLLSSYEMLDKFDIIFCRNVLIYFDHTTKAAITRKMKGALKPHGILVIGSTESLTDPEGLFTPIGDFRGAYRLKTGG